MTPSRERIERIAREQVSDLTMPCDHRDVLIRCIATAEQAIALHAEEDRRESPLTQALDDGKEVRMFKSANYYVLISGDCHAQGRSKESLSQAIEEAARIYAEWMARTE